MISPARTLKRWLWRHLPAGLVRSLYPLWRGVLTLLPSRARARRRYRRLNRRLPPSQIALREDLILGIDPRAREGFEHFCFRSLEMAEELDAFRSLASQRNRFVDIGAYFGIFTLVFLRDRPAGRAVAVEPSPLARKILRANLSANGMEHATVVDVALGARTASLVARLNEYHLEATEAPEVSGEDATVQVPTRSLDDLCDELGVAPDLLKVDVEGFEIEVLEGARRTLASHQPALMLELHPYLLRRQGRTASEVTSLLEDLGYRPRSLRGRALEWTEVAAVEEVSRIVCHPAPPDRDGG